MRAIRLLGFIIAAASLAPLANAQDSQITFHTDIEPILQRSCQTCHRDGGVAPMPLVTYEQVAPFAGLIEYKTSIRDRAGAMPPWYVEKDIGIQQFKSDPSLSDEEIAAISTWARSGTPQGNPADAPEPLSFDDSIKWKLGEPDLVVSTEDFFMEGGRPDWWGDLTPVPTGMSEDRYVKSVEIVEVNDVPQAGSARETVGGRYIFHHMIWRTEVLDENGRAIPGESVSWPVHEVARNGDVFDPDAGPLLKANSAFFTDSVHMHSNGLDTTGRLEIGFRFHDEGYEPKYRSGISILGNGSDISVEGDATNQT
ncbi:MAG: cytochrome c, partial [Gammaproteobacteria bacterium]